MKGINQILKLLMKEGKVKSKVMALQIILAVLLLLCDTRCAKICFASQKNLATSSSVKTSNTNVSDSKFSESPVIVTVDLSVLFTFHPAMRDFDHISGKFVSQKPYSPPKGGKTAWERLKDKREQIEKLEEELDNQLNRANAEILKNSSKKNEKKEENNNQSYGYDENIQIQTIGNDKKDDVKLWKEYQKYVELAQEHRRLLLEVANEVIGGFPESLLGDLPEKELQRITSEIYKEIEEIAKKENADIVLNLPTFSSNLHSINVVQNNATSKVQDILDSLNIRRLKDIEFILQASEESQNLPIGKDIPKGNPAYKCGGHFESVTDYDHMRALVEQYFIARKKFCVPFEKFGAMKIVLRGKAIYQEKDITIEVLERIFNLYKTRELERKVILNYLRGIRG